MAAGVDPKKTILFNQSQVHEHAELAWVFNCVARLGWLNRMTQFKEKAGKDRENASVGLFAYPTLMADDILLYLATHVPVGSSSAASRSARVDLPAPGAPTIPRIARRSAASAEAIGTLNQQVGWLTQKPGQITIEGHADERGTREYNLALGARRASAVRDFMIARGVPANRMKTVSYGKERPVAVCDDISFWSQNRRAVTVLDAAG